MFLYNFKINSKRLIRFMFIVMLLIIFIIFSIGVYKIFFKKTESQQVLTLADTIKNDEVFEITPDNYTDILQTVTNDIDSYIGCKIHFTGYIYRLIDFDENEFVLARDMVVNKNTNQSLVVGFLCMYENAKDFPDDTWVDLTGTIIKGDYYGDIAQVQVTNMFECQKPEDKYVMPPDNTYIPTVNMF